MRAMAEARTVAVAESTATLERQVSVSCSGTGNLNVGTRGVQVSGLAVTPSIKTGIRMVPKTPLWSKNEVMRVVVPLIWSSRCFGSQMVRWSIYVAWSS